MNPHQTIRGACSAACPFGHATLVLASGGHQPVEPVPPGVGRQGQIEADEKPVPKPAFQR